MMINSLPKLNKGFILLIIPIIALGVILLGSFLYYIISVKGNFFWYNLNKNTTAVGIASAAHDDTGYFRAGNMSDNNAATADDIDKTLAGTKMAGSGKAIKKAADKYHLNPVYIAAHAALESGWGNSKIAQDKKNYFGFMAYDSCPYECAKTYSSFDESVDDVMGYVKTKYLTPGGAYYEGETLEAMNQHYATDQTWAYKIKNIMLGIYRDSNKTPPVFSGEANVT